MKQDFYERLGVSKNASHDDIKRAYRKLAMQYHPDKNKGNQQAETQFKSINEAYETLSDKKKRKQYDTFGSTGYSGGYGNAHSGFSGTEYQNFSGGGFDDFFKNFGKQAKNSKNQSFYNENTTSFDFSDLFEEMKMRENSNNSAYTHANSAYSDPYEVNKQSEKSEPKRDVIKTYELAIFDCILGTKIDVQTVYNQNLKLKIPQGTQPGTKFKISGKGRNIDGKVGDMYVVIQAKMPQEIPDDVRELLESIKYRL